MLYSEIVKNGLILPKKQKYTIRDANNLIIKSLFNSNKTLSINIAKFICRCSAVFHDTDFSKSLTNRK